MLLRDGGIPPCMYSSVSPPGRVQAPLGVLTLAMPGVTGIVLLYLIAAVERHRFRVMGK
jgi:hypothetical protein